MSIHGDEQVTVGVVNDVVVYLRERCRKLNTVDYRLHGKVLPRGLNVVRELHYKFVLSRQVIGEAKVWVYRSFTRCALILDYSCDIVDHYTRLLKCIIDDLRLHYDVRVIYIDTTRVDLVESRLLGRALRELNFVVIDSDYAMLALR